VLCTSVGVHQRAYRETDSHDTYLHCCSNFSNIITNVFLASALEWNFGAHNTDKNTNLVLCLVYFVVAPATLQYIMSSLIASESRKEEYQCGCRDKLHKTFKVAKQMLQFWLNQNKHNNDVS
jgi:hypothetical protein